MSSQSEQPGDRGPDPVVGIVLAAGAGTRMGRPKALVVGSDGEPWLRRAARTLGAGGCTEVVVVLGAAADRARLLIPTPSPPDRESAPTASASVSASTASTPTVPLHVVAIDDWETGISASLRAGLDAARSRGATAAVITLVDLPDLTVAAVHRMLAPAPHPTTLRQAAYDGRPGHPVVIGRDHLDALSATLHGDTGARPYLKAHGVDLVDCSDLGGGDDVDSPAGRLDAG